VLAPYPALRLRLHHYCLAVGIGLDTYGGQRQVLTGAQARAGAPRALINLPGNLAALRKHHSRCGAQDPTYRQL
jgi:hypothetical protein